MTASNIYISQKQSQANEVLLKNIACYITYILEVFGCGTLGDSFGFSTETSRAQVNKEEEIMPFLDLLANIRLEIRSRAKELKSKDLFALCDSIRDDILPNLGVRMEDYETDTGLKTRIKLVDKEILLKEREEKLKATESSTKNKKSSAPAVKVAVEAPIPPSELFRKDTDKYSLFNENGIPTHDAQGNELTKSALKKIAKVYESQEKKYNNYLKTLEQGDTK